MRIKQQQKKKIDSLLMVTVWLDLIFSHKKKTVCVSAINITVGEESNKINSPKRKKEFKLFIHSTSDMTDSMGSILSLWKSEFFRFYPNHEQNGGRILGETFDRSICID